MGRPPAPHSAPATARTLLLLIGLLALPAAGGCRRPSVAAANVQTYGELDCRRPAVPELAGSLDVDAADRIAEAARRGTTYVLALDDALALAASASRPYLTQREEVYLTALELTGVQNQYRPLFDISGGGSVIVGEDGATTEGGILAGVSKVLETGGSIAVGLASDFVFNISTADPFRLARTILTADVLLPLARGSGRLVAREPLTQAERDTLYAMRDYARFQQDFTVETTTRFYRVLQDRDVVKNTQASYETLQVLVARQEAMGKEGAGRVPDFEVDQSRQNLLSTADRLQRARLAYASSLDGFKLLLGVPVTVDLELKDDDLDRLRKEGPLAAPFTLEEAEREALKRRLDLDNAVDAEEDTWRQVLIAKDGLGPQVDLILDSDATGPDQKPVDIRSLDPLALLGIEISLPVERTLERNLWRRSLIQASRARRNVEETRDRIILEVRDAFRRLEETRRSYEIQTTSVELATRRVHATDLLLEAGRASTRDRLDAQDSLVSALNERTGALIDHTLARLRLENAVGTLLVHPDASWTPLPPKAPGPAAGAGAAEGGSANPADEAGLAPQPAAQ